MREGWIGTMASMGDIKIFVETGKRWVFAGAVNWPGWCRRGKGEEAAIQALLEAGPKYSEALSNTKVEFILPASADVFHVIQRVEGNATTDFGAPDAALESDADQVDPDELARLKAILGGCWEAFDQAVKKARGKDLRKGPRGGGRDLEKIIDHLVEGDKSYLARIGWKAPKLAEADTAERLRSMRLSILDGLGASARGELPLKGPRGGLRWPARRFVRRVAWHALDHAWEIEDRLE
jgi:hypothetical protein